MYDFEGRALRAVPDVETSQPCGEGNSGDRAAAGARVPTL